jgi:small-conductance mechanosensitive channel
VRQLINDLLSGLPDSLAGDRIFDWLIALAVLAGSFVVLRTVLHFAVVRLRRLADRTPNRTDDAVVDVLAHTRSLVLLAVAMYLGALTLELPPAGDRVLHSVLLIALFIQAGIWGGRLVQLLLERYAERKGEEDPGRVSVLALFGFFGQVGIWTVVLILSLENLGVDVTALVAGLGLGGIAVGLALQNVLRDTFGSLSIVLDKPFEVGDFIIVGDLLGTVEKVGIKTTRVRSLSGEQLVFGNDDLLTSRVRNYKRMAERRVLFTFGVVYQTPADSLERIPQMVREIVEGVDQTRFDRAHFRSYGDFSLDFEVVYYVLDPDYDLYMDVQQAINLALYRRFEEAGIDFAYPTRTLYLEGGPTAPESVGQVASAGGGG